jgi:hypothetical protein
MFYVVLLVQLAVLALIVAAAVRWFRVKPEQRSVIVRQKKKAILVAIGASVVVFVAISAAIFSFFGVTGIRATSAAKDYLRDQYGPRDAWEISLSGRVERSKKPEAGSYQIHYLYGEKQGDLVAEYFERDGKLAFKITPKEK